MKALLRAAAVAGLLPLTSYAQSNDELINGAKDTANVLNYGMGYNLQRYSPLTQINKQTVRRLTPVWNYSYDDNRSEESQPLVYKGVLYVSTHAATIAIDVKSGRAIWKTKVEYPPETPRIVWLRHHQPRRRAYARAGKGQYHALLWTPMLSRWMRRPGKKYGTHRSLIGTMATRRRWRRWSPMGL